MTLGNGSVAEQRIAEELKQCTLKEMGKQKLYSALTKNIGPTVSEKSTTYRNSSYTVFITFEVVEGIKRADIYGEFNGTNLDPSCPASLGSGTSEYTEEDEPIVTKPNGGTTTPSFDNSDLSGGGSTSGDTPPANTPGSCGIAGHYDGDGRGVHGVPVDRCANNHTYTCECIPIPAGATYTTNLVYTEDEEFGDTTIDSSNAIVYREGDCFPAPTLGDIYNFGDYSYGYQVSPGGWFSDWSLSSRIDGWCAKVNDTTKTSYETPLSHINFVPLTAIESTYHSCSNLIHAPEIPSTVTNMNGAYTYCTKLQTAPVIHNGITDTSFAFYDCENLKVAPVVPDTVTEIWGMFSGDHQLETYEGNRDAVGDFSNYKIPRGVTDVSSLFSGCQKITAAPHLHDGIVDMLGAFNWCLSMEIGPELPSTLTKSALIETFRGCRKMKTYHGNPNPEGDFSGWIIPASITALNDTFYNCDGIVIAPNMSQVESVNLMNGCFDSCDNLQKVDSLPKAVNDMEECFRFCSSLKTFNATVPSNTQDLTYCFYQCYNLEGIVRINANRASVNRCFGIYTSGSNFTLVGDGNLQTLANTSSAQYRTIYDANGNILR